MERLPISAGIDPEKLLSNNSIISKDTLAVLEDWRPGVSEPYKGRKAKKITASDLENADLVLVMGDSHSKHLFDDFKLVPGIKEKTYLLTEIANIPGDIIDPVGRPEEYPLCRDVMVEAITNVLTGKTASMEEIQEQRNTRKLISESRFKRREINSNIKTAWELATSITLNYGEFDDQEKQKAQDILNMIYKGIQVIPTGEPSMLNPDLSFSDWKVDYLKIHEYNTSRLGEFFELLTGEKDNVGEVKETQGKLTEIINDVMGLEKEEYDINFSFDSKGKSSKPKISDKEFAVTIEDV